MDLMRAFMWVIKSAPDVAFLIGMGGFGFGLFIGYQVGNLFLHRMRFPPHSFLWCVTCYHALVSFFLL